MSSFATAHPKPTRKQNINIPQYQSACLTETSFSSSHSLFKKKPQTLENRLSLLQINASTARIRQPNRTVLSKRLDLSISRNRSNVPIRCRNPYANPTYKLTAYLLQTYIKINENYFAKQSVKRDFRGEAIERKKVRDQLKRHTNHATMSMTTTKSK